MAQIRLPTINAISNVTEPTDLPLQIQSASVTLTDAQIKALPTTPIQVMAALGAGKLILPVCGLYTINSLGGAYGNTQWEVTSTLWTKYDINGPYALAELILGDVAALLENAHTRIAFLTTPYELNAPSSGNGIIMTPADVVNKALFLGLSNNEAGDLTGGNAANTLTVRVLFLVIDV